MNARRRKRDLWVDFGNLILDEADVNRHIDSSIATGEAMGTWHGGPWAYSSFHRYVKQLTETAAHLVDHVLPLGPGTTLGLVLALTTRIEIPIVYPSWRGAASVLRHST